MVWNVIKSWNSTNGGNGDTETSLSYEVVWSPAVWGICSILFPMMWWRWYNTLDLSFYLNENRNKNGNSGSSSSSSSNNNNRTTGRSNYRWLASFLIIWTFVGGFPFLAYAATGISWTGLELSKIHKHMIGKRHAFALFAWLGASIVQIVTVLFFDIGNSNYTRPSGENNSRKSMATMTKKAAKMLHRSLGRIALYYLIPIVLIEICSNAVFVFLPEKPYYLASVLLASSSPTILEIAQHVPATTVALCTPIYTGIYSWLSYQSLKEKKYRMHGIYAALIVCHTIAPGILRWIIRYEFGLSHCRPFGDPGLTILVQIVAANFEVLVRGTVTTLLYCLIPLEKRRNHPKNDDGRVTRSFQFALGTHTLSLLASYMLNVPAGIRCSN